MSTPIVPAAKAAAKPAAKPAAKKAPAKAAAKPTKKAAAKPAKASKKNAKAKPAKVVIDTSKRYKFLSGIDDSAFCQRVSDHLDAGYELYGSPTMVVKGSQVYVGQAIVRKAKSRKGKKK